MRGVAQVDIEPAAEPADSLLAAHLRGDADAFPALVQQYRRPVYGYLVRCGIDEADRDDLFQDIFIKIHKNAHRYDESRPLHPWLFTIVANTVRSYVRRKRWRNALVWGAEPSEPADLDSYPHEAPSSEALVEAKEIGGWLVRAIRALPMPQREVLVLATIEKLPLKDIASMLDIPVNTVKTHVRRARLRLVASYERRTRGRHD